jgi:phenylacetate-CoA ligase
MTRLPAIRALLRHSRASRADILAYQNAQLRALVQHAYARVPYYRSLFDRHGIQPRHIRSVADMPIIPITTKADLQRRSPAELVSEGVDPAGLVQRRTSGSSGQPFTVRRTRVEEHLLGAFRLRALHQYGLRPRDHAVAVTLHPLTEHARLDIAQRLSRLTGLYRRTVVNVLMEPPEIIRELRRLRPDMLAGYPGGLSNIATVLDEADRQAIRPRFVMAGAEVLTPVIRRQIATGFRAPVFDVYGSHEFNLLAWECTVTGQLHVCDDALILEVLQDHHSVAVGERGEVVGTNLHAFAMPFIRFRLGDVVTRGVDACPCGQPFSVISSVHGRMLDYFPLPDGRLLHPYHITAAAVRDASWMRQYRLIQERVDRIVMHIVPASEPTVGELAALHDRVRTLLPPSVVFVVDLVPKIELEANGKFRTSRSLVSSSYDGIAWDRIDDRPSPIGPPGS